MAKRQEEKVSPKSEHTQETNDRVNIQCVLALRVLQFILMEVLSGLGSLTGEGGEKRREEGREREKESFVKTTWFILFIRFILGIGPVNECLSIG